LHKRS
jgi:hypothetical protein